MNWVIELVRAYNSSGIQTRRVRRKESLAKYESAVLPHGGRRCLERGSCMRGAACFPCMYTFALHQHTRSTEDMPILRSGRAYCNGDEYQLEITYGELVRSSAAPLSASTRAFRTLKKTCHQLRRPALPPSAGPKARISRRKCSERSAKGTIKTGFLCHDKNRDLTLRCRLSAE